MSEMEERVARAVFDSIAAALRDGELSESDLVYNPFPQSNPAPWENIARATIEAMEPYIQKRLAEARTAGYEAAKAEAVK